MSFTSKGLSPDEETLKQRIGTSFLSNDSRGDSSYYDELLGELRSPEGKSDTENLDVEGKVKYYTKSDWEKILEFDDLENTSTTEMLLSLRYGIPFELFDINQGDLIYLLFLL